MRAAIAIGAVVIVGLVVGTVSIFKSASHATISPLRETLGPERAAAGPGARVITITVHNSLIDYDVLGADGLAHQSRWFDNYNSTFRSGTSARKPTGPERAHLGAPLADLSPHVLDRLFARLGIPRSGTTEATAVLVDGTWTITRRVGLAERTWTAGSDGSGLRADEGAVRKAGGPAVPVKPPGTKHAKADPTLAPPVADPAASRGQRLLNCVQRAHGSLQKLAACQRRYAP